MCAGIRQKKEEEKERFGMGNESKPKVICNTHLKHCRVIYDQRRRNRKKISDLNTYDESTTACMSINMKHEH